MGENEGTYELADRVAQIAEGVSARHPQALAVAVKQLRSLTPQQHQRRVAVAAALVRLYQRLTTSELAEVGNPHHIANEVLTAAAFVLTDVDNRAVRVSVEPPQGGIEPGDFYKHHTVVNTTTGRRHHVLGGDARYEVTGPGFRDYRHSPQGDCVLLESAEPTHPWGLAVPLIQVAAMPGGKGMYHPDHLAGMMRLQLDRSYPGSWREYADHTAGGLDRGLVVDADYRAVRITVQPPQGDGLWLVSTFDGVTGNHTPITLPDLS